MSYIDGIVIPVRTADRDKFVAHAERLDRLFVQHGAIRVVDSWGMDVPDGKLTDFKRAVAATDEETVAFGWIEWPDKAARNAGWHALESDPAMAEQPAPFDGKRMIYGGFEPIIERGEPVRSGYVQGFVVPVKADRKDDYRKLAEEVWELFAEFGGRRVIEAWQDDVPHGQRTDFFRAVDAEADEAVVFSLIEWDSKAACDAAAAKMQSDERMKSPPPDMPFDGKRMIFGGFTPVVDLGE
jgi:uncharacterized protein YbaA (DUF1428 family)